MYRIGVSPVTMILVTMIAVLCSSNVGASKLEGVRPLVMETLDVRIEDPEWSALVEWAVDRYSAVGIDLPRGVVSMGDDQDYCGGNSGQFRSGEVPEVRLCVDRDATSRVAHLIVLHELAHLWAENVLSEERKAAFLEVRGLTNWASPALPRHEWGAEHAAEVLSWGLMDDPVRIIRIYNASPEALRAGFVVLTGVEPLVEDEESSLAVG